jgi:hypothetical protein
VTQRTGSLDASGKAIDRQPINQVGTYNLNVSVASNGVTRTGDWDRRSDSGRRKLSVALMVLGVLGGSVSSSRSILTPDCTRAKEIDLRLL